MSLREPAWRVTARELESSLEAEKGEGERPATYLLSPFAARMNRVLVAGNLSPAESIGRDESQAFWRARLSDPTGAVAVTAGSFQPRAMAQLRAGSTPRPAIVVGKVHLFRGRDGVGYVSVRAEAVRSVAEAEERAALADIVRQTLDRLDLLERVEKEPGLTEETLRTEGTPVAWLRAARESRTRYPNVDRAAFRRDLRTAVRRVAGESGPSRATAPPAPALTVTHAPPPRPPAPAPSAAERAQESLFLDQLDEVADVSADGYADLKEVLSRVSSHGLLGDRAEEILNRLEEEGVIEEPIVGKLRRA
jgi:RPA family protein